MTGPQDPAAAGRGRLRAGHADREQAIDTLKAAFVHGQLTKDELDVRAGQALAARTYADLAALTADIPPCPPAARPARPPAPVRRRPLARAAAKSGICLIIAASATWVCAFLLSSDGHYGGVPGANSPYESLAPLALLLAAAAVCTQSASWGVRWSNRWSSGAPEGNCRLGRAAPPWKPSGAEAPVMARFPPAPAPTRPRPTCGLTSHRSGNGTFPPRRAGHPVA
jgi:hypothetical protein